MALRIAVFGQAPFGKEVVERVAAAGHELVGVYVPPDRGRPDPLAELAEERGWPLFRHRSFRRKGEAIPERVEEYRALGAELNLMPYTTVILPPEIVFAPARGSLCFHPSLLPAFRGGAAIPWQIILGAETTGVSVFQPDEGVDTGPLIVQKGGVEIEPSDTAASLYFNKLYPLGVEAILEALEAVDRGDARLAAQTEEGASFQGLLDDAAARIDWSRPAPEIDRLLRGCDPQPGAHAQLDAGPDAGPDERTDARTVRLFDARLEAGDAGGVEPGTILGFQEGRMSVAATGGRLSIGKVRIEGEKKLPAAEAGIAPGEGLR